VPFTVERFYKHCSLEERDELIEEGYIALCYAARNFDPAPGFRFSTFAVMWIRGKLGRTVAGFHAGAFGSPARCALDRRAITKEDLPRCLSLETPRDNDAGSGAGTLGDTLTDGAEDPETAALRRDQARELWAFVAGTLNARQAEAIRLYYAENMTLEEVADHLGVSRQCVQQRLKAALTLLRKRAPAVSVELLSLN
jgi:RNA polymerase sigma factor (sigma-70 family)